MWLQELFFFFPHPVRSSRCVRKLQNVHLSVWLHNKGFPPTHSVLFIFVFLNLDALMGGRRRNEIYCYDHVPALNGNRGMGENLEQKEAKKPQRALPLLGNLQRFLCSNVIFCSF